MEYPPKTRARCAGNTPYVSLTSLGTLTIHVYATCHPPRLANARTRGTRAVESGRKKWIHSHILIIPHHFLIISLISAFSYTILNVRDLMFSKGNKYTCHFSANFLCHGNRHLFAAAKMAKAAKPKHKNRPFSGAFPKNKMYLFIKFSTRTHIQLEMGLKRPILGQFPVKEIFLKKWH